MFISSGGQNEGDFAVENNVVEDCSSTAYSVIELDVISGAYKSLAFIGNRIIGCQGNKVVFLDSVPTYASGFYHFVDNIIEDSVGTEDFLVFNSYPFSTFERNLFINSTATSSVRLGPSFSSTEDLVPLPANYWGTFQNDVMDLRRTVFDGLTSPVTSVIDFMSVLASPALGSSIVNVSLPGLFLSDGSIGGFLTSGAYELDGKLDCSLAIFVAGNASLVLKPAVDITFQPGTALRVSDNAQVVMEGSDSLPIVLGAANESDWRGVLLDGNGIQDLPRAY